MRKYLLAFALIAAFAWYAWYAAFFDKSRPSPSSGAGSGSVAAGTPPQSSLQPQAPSSQSQPSSPQSPAPPSAKTSGLYTDGAYTGPVTDAFYGPMQVEAVIRGGALSNIKVLQSPSDVPSQEINGFALPQLVSEAIQAQSGNVNIVSGATLSSEAFAQSLAAALASAKS